MSSWSQTLHEVHPIAKHMKQNEKNKTKKKQKGEKKEKIVSLEKNVFNYFQTKAIFYDYVGYLL